MEQVYREQEKAEERTRKQSQAFQRAREQARREARRVRVDGSFSSSKSIDGSTAFSRRHPADAEIHSRGWQLMKQQDRLRTPAQHV